jgi:hypothetical protein
VRDALDTGSGREADEAEIALVLIERPLGSPRKSLPGEVLDDVGAERGPLVGLVPHRAEHLPPLAESEARSRR